MKRKDLKFFEVHGEVYYIEKWHRDNPGFIGPPNWYECWGGWFWYHIVATNEDDAKIGAMKQFNQFSPPLPFKEEHDFYFKKPRLIEWVSYHTAEARKNIAP